MTTRVLPCRRKSDGLSGRWSVIGGSKGPTSGGQANYTGPSMDPLNLPLDYAAIEHILPHRYPFLLVDRVTELEPDKRIVGIKNVSLNERYLSHQPGERPALPPTILTECIAQVGAILILSKAENRGRIPLFRGIERVRFRATGLRGRCRRDRSQGQEPAQPCRPAAWLRARERSRGCRWNDDVRARANGAGNARRNAPLDQRRRLLFHLHVVTTAFLRTVERCVRARDRCQRILIRRVHHGDTEARSDRDVLGVPGDWV